MPRPKQIHIAGAGLVGSLLSVMLGKRGYEVSILERRPDTRKSTEDSGRSINLALSSRGIAALERAGLMDDVQPLLIPMTGRMLHLEDGTQQLMPYGQRPEEVIYSVSRRDLNRLMITKAEEAPPVNVMFNQQLESIDFENKLLHVKDLSDDQTARSPFELIIGADGAGSPTRRSLLQANQGESTSEFLDHDYKELEIPARPGFGDDDAKRFPIDPNALHIWPRGNFMLIALPNQDGSFTVTLFMPKTGPISFEALEHKDSVKPFFEKHFPSALQLIPDLEQDFVDNPAGRLGTLRTNSWFYEDCGLIIGDAAHAIVPFHGQGMNAGFEDCLELDRLLDEHNDDWAKVLPELDRLRRPNAEAIADMALENYVTMRSSVADPKFQLKKELGFKLEQQFPDRFIPRYSMVMFLLIPYAEAFRRGQIQQDILSALTETVDAVDDVDMDPAKSLVDEKLPPIEFD